MSNDASVDYLAKLRAAAAAIQKQQATIARLEAAQSEPIAIIGMGCRFPGGADDPDAFWSLLANGVDAIREVPAERWSIDEFFDTDPDALGTMSTRWGGFLDGVDQFDARFFRISPREAISMDPQQRLLLEVSWAALEHAAIDPTRLSGSETGVFVGLTTLDYAKVIYRDDVAQLDTYCATGNVANVASGRLSYFYGFRGPSLTVDTACSSSLVAIHLACQSLRNGESTLALAAGVNLMLAPDNSIAVSRAHMLSPDGRCKTFDRAANGYARSEGCGVVVLKRLSQAVADGDRVCAVIRGSAIRQDGARSGLTVPNGPAQERVIRAGLQAARVKPAEVSYVEAHGTGTSLGDPIEAEAIGTVFSTGRPASQPLVIGALKTNLGHMESAAGVGGIIKTVLALQHAEIPRHLHLQAVHPEIALGDIPAVVPTTHRSWPSGYASRIAGVSSFGSSGTVAHVVLEQAPEPATAPLHGAEPLCVLPISAATPRALTAMRQRYASFLDTTDAAFVDVATTASVGRAHLALRIAVVASRASDAAAQLRQRATDVAVAPPPRVRDTVFLCTAAGAEHVALADGLAAQVPAYQRAMAAVELLVQSLSGKTLADVAGAAVFARNYAMAAVWRAWGLTPAAVMSDDATSLVADCIAGIVTLEEALRELTTAVAATRRAGSIPRTVQQVSTPAAFLSLGTDTGLRAVRASWSGAAIWAASIPGDATASAGRACETLLQSAAALYESGCDINWDACIEGRVGARVLIPVYAFDRERFWPEQPASARSPKQRARASSVVAATSAIPSTTVADRGITFGIMFFNGSESADPADNYRLLLEATRFADQHGFSSTWIPERHFTRFGSLYPNPATVHAALARETSRIRLMAGSVVMPLHHPLRLTEEWSVVDNLSNGRVGMSFAAGWNPDDFALNPGNYADRQEGLFRGIEQVRRLWKGDALDVSNGAGATSQLRTYPRPVQRELPLWVTAASNPRTFERAGSIGANLLTHLLDHDVDELAEKIQRYRKARADHGHDPNTGQVTVMLHTFLGSDIDTVHAKVREPYCRYLKENIHLLKGLAVHRGSDFDLTKLSDADLDGFVGFLYERFFSTRALMGTVESCAPLVQRLEAAGVNEIACLLDFGPGTDDVLASLPTLCRLVDPEQRAAALQSSSLTEHTYTVRWSDVAWPTVSAARARRRTAVVGDAQGVGAALVSQLTAAGRTAVLVSEAARAWPEVDDVVFLKHIDRHATREVATGLDDAVRCYQAVSTERPTAKLWFATRGGQRVRPEDQAVPSQAALGAMLKVLPIERPQMWGGLIDLDPAASPMVSAQGIARVLLGDAGEDQLAMRGDRLVVARLTPTTLTPSSALPLRADASYLVTGGLRGLGLEAARWLAARGARHLILAGRSGVVDPSGEGVMAELDRLGVDVVTVPLDVTNRDAVQSVIDEGRRRHRPAIAGVVHAAGVWQDAPLAELTTDQLARVLAPKVDGTLALAECLPSLDFFLGFSAFSALLPAETQGNYAAANAFLDAYLSSHASPTWMSVNWGPWSEIGFAATPYGRRAHERLESIGIARIVPRDGFAFLDLIAGGGASGIGVMTVDWPRLFTRDPNARLSPFLRELSARHAVASGDAGRVRDLLAGLGSDAEISRLEAELTVMAATIMRLAPDEIDRHASFTDLGVDSLMAVELKNRIRHDVGVDLPLVKLLEGPSISELARLVSAHLKLAELSDVAPSGADVMDIEI